MCDAKELDHLFSKLSSQNIVEIKSQQLGDPDLTTEEKVSHLRQLFSSSPARFLGRFGRCLNKQDVTCLEHLKDDYEIAFHLKEIKRHSGDRSHHILIRNRRYKAMKELENQGEYFEHDQMRKRCPLLFEQFVGAYMDDEEISALRKNSDRPHCLSEFLLDCVDNTHQRLKYCVEKKEEEESEKSDCIVEEDDDSEEEGNEMVLERHYPIRSIPKGEETVQDNPHFLSKDEKVLLQQDFLALMQERFLNGEEEDFDYSSIDDNVMYDSLDIRDRDEEEMYFDAD